MEKAHRASNEQVDKRGMATRLAPDLRLIAGIAVEFSEERIVICIGVVLEVRLETGDTTRSDLDFSMIIVADVNCVIATEQSQAAI